MAKLHAQTFYRGWPRQDIEAYILDSDTPTLVACDKHRKIAGFFPEDPVELFRRNVWINPFWEDDVYEIAELMGADRVIFGSDWPHIEGMPEPLDYARELKDFTPDERRLILHDNAVELNTLRPA